MKIEDLRVGTVFLWTTYNEVVKINTIGTNLLPGHHRLELVYNGTNSWFSTIFLHPYIYDEILKSFKPIESLTNIEKIVYNLC
jgi:hypothetical protein